MATPKVTVRPCKVRGKKMWRVRRRVAGKPERTFFKTKAEADAEADRLRAEQAAGGDFWTKLPAHERTALMSAYSESKNRGVDIHRALNHTPPANAPQPNLQTVISELLGVKERAGRAKGYTKNLKIVLNQFAKGRESLAIDRVTFTDVEKFLDDYSLEYRPTLRSRLSTLFKFTIRRMYRTDNPCDRLEAVTVPHKPPAIFTLEQVQLCISQLREFRSHALPWFILTTLCGLRPEEAEKTTKADIHFKEGWIRVEAQTTKVRQRRVVYPMPEAMEALKAAMQVGKLPLNHEARRRTIRFLRAKLGWKAWPKDVTRHTAASYWLAHSGSAATVSEMLGNSEKS